VDTHTLQIIVEYRYAILIPLSFIEGPIVAFFAGTLASAGYFNVWALAVFFLARDIIVDFACYMLGYAGGQAAWVTKLLRRMRVTDQHLADIRKLWHAHPGKTMFLSKLSYGVAAGFIVVAGLVRMPLGKFLKYGSIIAVLHYGTLLFVGYFFGATFGGSIVAIIEKIPYVLLALSVLAIAYFAFKKYMTRQLERAEREVERE